MLNNLNGEVLGQAIIVVAFAIVGAYRIWAGHKKGDAAPPPHRALPPNEVKAACDNLAEAMERLQRKLDRHMDVSVDNMRELQRQLDRIESAVRLSSAMGEIERRYGRHRPEHD